MVAQHDRPGAMRPTSRATSPARFRPIAALAFRLHRGSYEGVPPADPKTARWLEAGLRPHEPELRAHLRAHFGRHLDLDDLVHEACARLLQAREQRAPLRSPEARLFATARNAALLFSAVAASSRSTARQSWISCPS
ncbi:MAG: hypothetical protein FJ399_01035 [Verrucomicrobia bacterium]|nr:hypothetical protein [Verrucomicrobiota bacterium]